MKKNLNDPRDDDTATASEPHGNEHGSGGVRAAIYIPGESAESIEHQRARLERHCRRRHWEIVGTYTRENQSEGQMSAMGHMLEDACAERFSAIVLPHLAYFGENANALLIFLEFAVKFKIRIVAVDDQVDTGRVHAARLIRALAEYEKKTNSRLGWVRPRDPCEGCLFLSNQSTVKVAAEPRRKSVKNPNKTRVQK